MSDITEIIIEDTEQVTEFVIELEEIEVSVELEDATDIIFETTSELPVILKQSASGIVASSVVWVLTTDLPFNPAGLMFWDDAGDPIDPVSILYAGLGVVIVSWLVARSGSWQAS